MINREATAGLDVVIVGAYHEIYFWTTERPLTLSGVRKVAVHPSQATDLACDVALINYPFDCVTRLPKAKVQLCLHTEQPYQYGDQHLWFMDHSDGGVCATGALDWWRGKTKKPHFALDIMTRWEGWGMPRATFPGPIAGILGGQSPHRDEVIARSSQRLRYVHGGEHSVAAFLAQMGMGANVHSPDALPKTESGRLAAYLNLGVGVISEPCDEALPKRWRPVIPQGDVVNLFGDFAMHHKRQLVDWQQKTLLSGPSCQEESLRLFTEIKAAFNL